MKLFKCVFVFFLLFITACGGGGGGGTKDYAGTWKIDVVKTYDTCSSIPGVNFAGSDSFSMLVNQDGEHVIADVGNSHFEGYTHPHPEYADLDDIVHNGFQVADIEYYRGIKAFEHYISVVEVHGDTGKVYEDIAFATEAYGNGTVVYCEVYYRGDAKRIMKNRMFSEDGSDSELQESLSDKEFKEKIFSAVNSQLN